MELNAAASVKGLSLLGLFSLSLRLQALFTLITNSVNRLVIADC